MTWTWCRECRSYHAPDRHSPTWKVWCVDWQGGDYEEDDPTVVRASDPEDAAEAWADSQEEDVESIMSGVTLVVQCENGTKTTVALSGELSVSWYAYRRSETGA